MAVGTREERRRLSPKSCRADFLLGTHLPSETRTLAAKVDDALRKAYARCFGADLLNAEGTWERQEDPTFHRDLMGLKASAGGGGYRNTARRAAFINAIANALPQMMGNETRQPPWPSLENVLGADSFKKNDVDTCWQTFFDSGSVWAIEFKSEIARIKELRAQAIVAAGREAMPNEIFDRPDNSFLPVNNDRLLAAVLAGTRLCRRHEAPFHNLSTTCPDGVRTGRRNRL